jgi:hypothetical protein
MRRYAVVVAMLVVAAGVLGVSLRDAVAHECDKPKHGQRTEACHPTPLVHGWRGSFVPLFGVNGVRCDNADPSCYDRRSREQRWREEWGCDTQYCFWLKWGQSAPAISDGNPQSLHAGMAADHSMTEAAHESSYHGPGESNHKAHGGSAYADICVASDKGTSYQHQPGACTGPKDTQVGFNVVDHDPCGLPVNPRKPTDVGIPIPCSDEYHVVRPLDTPYTQQQMAESQAETQRYANNPQEWLCGYRYKDNNKKYGAVPQYC